MWLVVFEFLRAFSDTIGRPLNHHTYKRDEIVSNESFVQLRLCLERGLIYMLCVSYCCSWPLISICLWPLRLFILHLPNLSERTKYIGQAYVCYRGGWIWNIMRVLKLDISQGSVYILHYIWWEIYLLLCFPPSSCWKYSWLWTIFSVGLEDWKQSIIACVNPQWQYNKRIKVWLFSKR